MKSILLIILCSFLVLSACKKDSFITSPDASVGIPSDTLQFDTVFTSTGSITKSFKIFNQNDQKLRISSVKLMGGNASVFKMNVDGMPTTEATDIDIEANDSIYVFVQVNINPSAGNLPFVLQDSIQVSYNGKNRKVHLEAWGQNAHFLRNKEITSDEIWTNDLPYVIQGFLHVPDGQKLTIEKGCRIYVHADAPLIIDGSLEVKGEKDSINRVYFLGDRLDAPYKDYPASWPGIYFRATSKNNIFNYAVIKNAYQAIAVQDAASNANPKLVLNQCVIDNAYDAGIIAENTSIQATNCLVSNCGKNIALSKGGSYQFTHCTVVSISNGYVAHKDPVLMLADNLNAVFTNCIFWGEGGTVENEITASGTTAANVVFNHPLWKLKTTPSNITASLPLAGPPQFDSINASKNYYDFRFTKGISPALDYGVNTGTIIDLDGNIRPVSLPDLGCFEKQ